MKYHKAKKMCWAIHYGDGKRLNWQQKTINKMEKHRRKVNSRDMKRIYNIEPDNRFQEKSKKGKV